MISFIHLSDIHFRKYSGDDYDVDDDLRNEVEQDIKHNFMSCDMNVQGILVCGDIAFSGKEKEYEVASTFMNHLCDILNIEKSSVFCVPGNHDVDQDIPRNEMAVKLLQDQLAQQKDTKDYDDKLARVFRSHESSRLLYLPIENYNTKFAGQYNCNLSPSTYEWQYCFPLSETYNLYLVGLNSTIISNEDDHATDTERLMRISNMQIPQRKDGVIYLTMCHHPPECWNDPEGTLTAKLDKRVAVQLYGHKHLQTIIHKESSLIIGSGATHPSRWEPDWIPRYNWISLSVIEQECNDLLIVKVYPRIYDGSSGQFVRDSILSTDQEWIEFSIPLDRKAQGNDSEVTSEITDTQPSTIPTEVNDWKKSFVYEFMNLSYFQRLDVLKKCDLDKPEDEGLKHVELLSKIIDRAEKQHCVEKLIAETTRNNVKGCTV